MSVSDYLNVPGTESKWLSLYVHVNASASDITYKHKCLYKMNPNFTCRI